MNQEETLKNFQTFWEIPDKNDFEVQERIRKSVKSAREYIKRKYGNNIPSNDEILEDYSTVLKISDNGVILSDTFFYLRTLKDLIKNPIAIFEIYKEHKNEKEFWEPNKFFTYRYTPDLKRNSEIISYDALIGFFYRKRLDYTKDDIISLGDNPSPELLADLKNYLMNLYKNNSAELSASYIVGIVELVYGLRNVQVLEQWTENNNYSRKQMGLESLQFDFLSDKKSGKISLEDLINVKMLAEIPFEKLVLMHAFYSNKVKKVSDKLGLGLFIGNKLNILTSNTPNFDMDKAMLLYSQYMTINKISEFARDTIQNDVKGNVKYFTEDVTRGQKIGWLDNEKLYKGFLSQFEKVYETSSGGPQDLHEDYLNYILVAPMNYSQKDFALETILLLALENFQTINWGYIPETDKYRKSSISLNKKQILLAFDMEGFNMPIRLHMPLEKVRAVFKSLGQGSKIPNYIGEEDMEVWGNNIGASILVPLSPHNRKHLISEVKKMKPDNFYYGFARHIECMQYSNNLFRIQKWKDPNGRKGERTYTDVFTGEITTPSRGKA